MLTVLLPVSDKISPGAVKIPAPMTLFMIKAATSQVPNVLSSGLSSVQLFRLGGFGMPSDSGKRSPSGLLALLRSLYSVELNRNGVVRGI